MIGTAHPSSGGTSCAPPTGKDWPADLDRWLAPFTASLRHKTRGRMFAAYVAGLIAPGDRKSMQPMAARAGKVSYDQLHHFLTSAAWDAAALEAVLLAQAIRLTGAHGSAWLVIADAALPKKGAHSVGVAPQYAAGLGRRVNCQTLISVGLAVGVTEIQLALRLYLPASWTSQPERLDQAGVPENFRPYRDKVAIALSEIDRVRAAGVRSKGVLIDAGFGLSLGLRRGLDARDIPWAICIPTKPGDCPEDGITLAMPLSHGPTSPVSAADPHRLLAAAVWQTIGWRGADHRRKSARYTAMRVMMAGPRDEPPAEVWLIGEQPTTGEPRYYLSNLPAHTSLKQFATLFKIRQANAAGHQQLRKDLGLEHFEGRSWAGLHRHCLMTIIAAAFLQAHDAG